MTTFTLSKNQIEDYSSLITILLKSDIIALLENSFQKGVFRDAESPWEEAEKAVSAIKLKPTMLLNMSARILGYKSHSDLLYRAQTDKEDCSLVRLSVSSEWPQKGSEELQVREILSHYQPSSIDDETWFQVVKKSFIAICTQTQVSDFVDHITDMTGGECRLMGDMEPIGEDEFRDVVYMEWPTEMDAGIWGGVISPCFTTMEELNEHIRTNIKEYRKGAISDDGFSIDLCS